MKKLLTVATLLLLTINSYGQYRWEISGGPTFSNLNLDDIDSETGTGFYFNAGYGYVSGVRAKTSIVFSLDLLQRSSELEAFSYDLGSAEAPDIRDLGNTEFKVLQIGFNPKFRYLFNTGKDRFRPFINAGPSIRYTLNAELGELELEDDQYEQLIIGGVYGAGFSQMIGEMFDVMLEVGAMNDFTDNLKDTKSKFFDIYARVGVRFRIYDARR